MSIWPQQMSYCRPSSAIDLVNPVTAGTELVLETTLEAARRHGVAHEMLDAGEIRRRFPPFAVADGARGYFEPSAGFVRPEACVAEPPHYPAAVPMFR